MKLDLEKQTYFEVPMISSIKKYNYELDEVETDEFYIRSKLLVDLKYYDQNGDEKKKKLEVPIEILKDNEIKSFKLQIKNLRFEIIEGNGLSCNYELELWFDENQPPVEEKAIPIPVIIQPTIISDEIVDVSVPFMDEFRQEDETVIVTKSAASPKSFLDFFTQRESSFYSVKSVYVKNEDSLKEISKKYSVSLDDLYKGYDQEKGYVVFNVHSSDL